MELCGSRLWGESLSFRQCPSLDVTQSDLPSHTEKNLISGMLRCHPVKSKLAVTLLGSVFSFQPKLNIPRFRSWRLWKEYIKPRETSSTKMQYFCCPNFLFIKLQLLKFFYFKFSSSFYRNCFSSPFGFIVNHKMEFFFRG